MYLYYAIVCIYIMGYSMYIYYIYKIVIKYNIVFKSVIMIDIWYRIIFIYLNDRGEEGIVRD